MSLHLPWSVKKRKAALPRGGDEAGDELPAPQEVPHKEQRPKSQDISGCYSDQLCSVPSPSLLSLLLMLLNPPCIHLLPTSNLSPHPQPCWRYHPSVSPLPPPASFPSDSIRAGFPPLTSVPHSPEFKVHSEQLSLADVLRATKDTFFFP